MKAYLRLLVALIGLILSVYAIKERVLFENTVKLTDENLNHYLQQGEVWVITFYVPWCKHSFEFSPEL